MTNQAQMYQTMDSITSLPPSTHVYQPPFGTVVFQPEQPPDQVIRRRPVVLNANPRDINADSMMHVSYQYAEPGEVRIPFSNMLFTTVNAAQLYI